MANAVQSSLEAVNALTAKIAEQTNLGTVYMDLYTVPTTGVDSLDLDDYNANPATGITLATNATLTGYVRQAVTWNAVTNPSAGEAQALANTVQFVITAVVTTTTVYGWVIRDANNKARFAQDFPAAISITVPGTLTVGPGNTITWTDQAV